MQVVVSECGIAEANGNYKRSQKLQDGVVYYVKRGGEWKGRTNISFVIYRKTQRGGSKSWLLGVASEGQSTQLLYRNTNNGGSSTPPFDGWVATSRGSQSLPKLKWVNRS